ncbi:MAG: thioredoxin [Cyanobacteria bacterium P01_H01_bin.121]
MAAVAEISDGQFEAEVLKSEETVLVDFWATWCGPCRLIAPFMDWAASTYGDRLKVVKMEVDPNPETIAKYKVEGIPTLMLFRGGEVLDRVEGAIGKPKLETLLNTHLN